MRQNLAQSRYSMSKVSRPRVSFVDASKIGNKEKNWAQESKLPEELSEGTQLLREYIFYNKFDFLMMCTNKDGYDKGIIQQITFKYLLRKSGYKFLEKHILEICNDAPKDFNTDIRYKTFWYELKKRDKPESFLSFFLFKDPRTDSIIEDYNLIFSDNFFSKEKKYDLRAFGLDGLSLEDLRRISAEDDGLSEINNYNNQIVLKNFKIKLARCILGLIRTSMGYENNFPLPDKKIIQGLGLKPFQKNQNISPPEFELTLNDHLELGLSEDEIAYVLHLTKENSRGEGLTYKAFVNLLKVSQKFFKK